MKEKTSIIDLIRHPKQHSKKHTEDNSLSVRVCPYCNGSGINPQSATTYVSLQPQRCTVCGGRGLIPR